MKIFVVFLVATALPADIYNGYHYQFQPATTDSNATAINGIV
ncbi:MAG: hypothetical protein QXN66_02650 [Thermoplasmatales archaeon]